MSSERRLAQRIVAEQRDEFHYEKAILCEVWELNFSMTGRRGDNQTSGVWGLRWRQDKDNGIGMSCPYIVERTVRLLTFAWRLEWPRLHQPVHQERPSLNRHFFLFYSKHIIFHIISSLYFLLPPLLLILLWEVSSKFIPFLCLLENSRDNNKIKYNEIKHKMTYWNRTNQREGKKKEWHKNHL